MFEHNTIATHLLFVGKEYWMLTDRKGEKVVGAVDNTVDAFKNYASICAYLVQEGITDQSSIIEIASEKEM